MSPAVRMLALLALILAPACRDRAAEYARRQCMTQCEDRNRACILGATSSTAVQWCSQEVSTCVYYCPR